MRATAIGLLLVALGCASARPVPDELESVTPEVEAPETPTCPAEVTGRVLSVDGVPVNRFRLNGEDLDSPNGKFRICAEPTREGRFVFAADGFATTVRLRSVFPTGVTSLGTVLMTEGREVSGRVRDAQTGAPVAGARVAASDGALPLDEKRGAVVTGVDGSFAVRVEEGVDALVVEHEHYAPTHSPLSEGEAPREIRLESGAKVRGKVSSASGEMLTVLFTRSDRTFSKEVLIDDGAYEVAGLPEGTYFVTLWDSAPPHRQHPHRQAVRFEVARNANAVLDLEAAACGPAVKP